MNREPFRSLLDALDPWLGQIVFIGGWAHRLYRMHPHARKVDYPPLMTLDTDIATPLKLGAGKRDLRERLHAHGFKEEFMGDHRPPATHYHLAGEESGFYAEFLSPLTGADCDHKQASKATIQIGGINSQRLRHIELLLHEPWQVLFDPRGAPVKVRVPNPVSFLAQKILIQAKRPRGDRAKDILYMHDTLEIFGARLQELGDIWEGKVAPQLLPRGAKMVTGASKRLFGDVTDDVRRAAEISAQRALSPRVIQEACQYGFAQVFL